MNTDCQQNLSRNRLCDVLVLGSGIAGLSAALAAAEAGSSVILTCRGQLFSGSSFYPGTWGLGLIGPAGEADQEDLIHSIEAVGCGMADPALVSALVKGIHPAIEKLEAMGVRLRKAQGGAGQKEYIPCFDHKHRDWNGIEFDSCRAVFSRRLRELKVETLECWEALRLVKDSDRVCGAVLSSGQALQYVGAGAVVLASGGYGSLFSRHLCTTDVEGLGQALALDAGCSLINLEFMQIMPGYLSPAYGTIFNEKVFRFSHLTENGRELLPQAERTRLLNQRSGHGPFTSRLADRQVDQAIAACPSGVTVTYDHALLQDPPEFVKTYFDWLRQAKGLTMEDPVIIGLFSHAANGGVFIHPDGSTQVPGLYAAGEVTGGMHGADRIGGLSTANGLVFGGKAGAAAAGFAENAAPSPECCPFSFMGASGCPELFRQLQALMTAHAMVRRSEAGLTEALQQVEHLMAARKLYQTDDISLITAACRLTGQLQTAQAILKAQLLRRESRGSHFREDHPAEDPGLCRRIRVIKAHGQIQAFFDD